MRLRSRSRLAATAAVGLLLAGVPALVADAAAAAEPVVSYTFDEASTQGWFARGGASVSATPLASRTGAGGLRTTGRTQTWEGPSVELAAVLQTGATYAISGYARMVAGQSPAVLALTVQRTPAGGATSFDFVTNATADDVAWVRLLGSYTVPGESSQLQLYLESSTATAAFDLDDVTITMTSPPPGGPPDEAGLVGDFEDGTAQGWTPRINSEVLTVSAEAAHSGQYGLVTTGRSAAYAGPAHNLLGRVSKGKKYAFSAWVRLAAGEAPADVRLSIERRSGGTPTYQTVAAAANVTAGAWVHLAGTYTLASDVDFLTAYVETASGTASLHLDDFQLDFIRPLPIQTDIPSLRDVLAGDFLIGAASVPSDTVGVTAELLAKHFDSTTPGNAMKWDATEPVEGQFTFTDADTIAAFARDHDIALRGHTLVWHSQTPAWVFQRADGTALTNSAEDKALLLGRLTNHIRAVAGRYAGQIYAWDVANEVVDENQPDGLRRSRWYEVTGLDYLRTAFRVAREVAPTAKLYLNDYNTEYPRKRQAMFGLVQRLRAEGVPIDGVGHQLHINVERPALAEIEQTLDTFARLGVAQQVTELDMSTYTNFVESRPSIPADVLALQGYRYRDVFDLFRRHRSQLNSVTVWGVSDAGTWLKNFPFPRLDLPLLFDEQLQAKPAYWGVVDPTRLPHLNRGLTVPYASPRVDGGRDLEWDLLPWVSLTSRAGRSATFQLRWDTRYLYVVAEVADPTRDSGDAVEVFVDQNNAKTTTYQADDAAYRIHRDGRHPGAIKAETKAIPGGYRVEAAIGLLGAVTPERRLGFDLRFRDASRPADALSWNDNQSKQDADTSRWGTLTPIGPVRRVDAGKGTPTVDATVDPVWSRAATLRTTVQVAGMGGATATAKVLWDAQHVYVLATVTDPVLDESGANPYEQDSIEIFVDPDNSKSTGYTDEDGLYRISFSNRQTSSGTFDGVPITDRLRSATRQIPGGYVVEASIQLDTIRLAAGGLVGFDLQVNDASGGTRTAVHTWQDPTGLSYLNTSRWGVVRLTGH